MRELASGAQLRLVLQVVLNVRLASILLLFLTTPEVVETPAVIFGLTGLILSFVVMRRIVRYGRLLTQSRWFPTVDALVALGLVFSADPFGPSIAYAAGTAFMWALVARAWVVYLTVVPLFLALGFSLAEHLLDDDRVSYWIALLKVALLYLAVLAGRRARRLYLRQARLEEAASTARVQAAQAEERTRLSIEMHDSVAKSLHGIHLMAEHLQKALENEGHPLSQHALTLRESVAHARSEARTLVQDYRNAEPDDTFVVRLAELANQWETAQSTVQLRTKISDARPGIGSEHEWLKAVGELLENVSRHAEATEATLLCEEIDGWVQITVQDNGQGMRSTSVGDHVDAGHFGLDGVLRRMRRIGGSAQIHSVVGQGTTVELKGPTTVEGLANLGGSP